MKYLMIWLVKLYRKFISPIKPPCCRFTPTCSAYALEAFKKRGFFVGLILTVWRILRCNPFSKGGYDPVPLHGFKNPPDINRNTESGDGCDTAANNFEKE
jgi:putative membrane protein insertion efficiency factor